MEELEPMGELDLQEAQEEMEQEEADEAQDRTEAEALEVDEEAPEEEEPVPVEEDPLEAGAEEIVDPRLNQKPTEPLEAQPPGPEEDEAPEEPKEPEDEIVELNVCGEKRYVPRSTVIETGLRSLQKVLAADKFLEEAKMSMRQAQQAKEDAERARDEAQQYLDTLRAEPVPDMDPDDQPEDLRHSEEAPGGEPEKLDPSEITKIRQFMAHRFPGILTDVMSYKLLNSLVNEKLASGEKNSIELYDSCGREIEAWQKAKEVEMKFKVELEDKRGKKRGLDYITPAHGRNNIETPRKPQPEAIPGRSRVESVIDEIKRARGQNPNF